MNKVLYSVILFSNLFSFSTHAVEEINITNAHISSSSEERVATLEASDVLISALPFKISHPAPVIHFQLHDNGIQAQMNELLLDYQFNEEGVLSNLSGIDTQNFDLFYKNAQELNLSLDYLTLNFDGQKTHIPRLDLTCQRDNLKALPFNLDLCLQVGRVSMPVLNLDQLTTKSIAHKFQDLTGLKSNQKGLDELEDINIQVFKGSLNMSFKAKFLFKWKVKVKGHTSWSEDKQQLRIDVHSAKVGFLSIKKTLFNAIRDANIAALKISGNSLIIQL